MSGTVNYPKVIGQLTDVIKELNVPCGEAVLAEQSRSLSAETRQRDAVDVLKALLSTLEQGGAGVVGDAGAGAAAGGAAAEHSASAAENTAKAKAPRQATQMAQKQTLPIYKVGDTVAFINSDSTPYIVTYAPTGLGVGHVYNLRGGGGSYPVWTHTKVAEGLLRRAPT
jgi:hypothetical protein